MGDVANIEQHKRMLGQPRYSYSQASSDKEREDTALGHCTVVMEVSLAEKMNCPDTDSWL